MTVGPQEKILDCWAALIIDWEEATPRQFCRVTLSTQTVEGLWGQGNKASIDRALRFDAPRAGTAWVRFYAASEGPEWLLEWRELGADNYVAETMSVNIR